MAVLLQTLNTEQQLIGCTRKRPPMPHSWQRPDKSRCDSWQRCVLPSRVHTLTLTHRPSAWVRVVVQFRVGLMLQRHAKAARPPGNPRSQPDRQVPGGQACRGDPMRCCCGDGPRSGSRCCGWSRTAAWRTGWWWTCCGAGRSCWWRCSGGAAWPPAPPAPLPAPTGAARRPSRTSPAMLAEAKSSAMHSV